MRTSQALHKWCSCLPASFRGGTNLISERHVLGAWWSLWREKWFVAQIFEFYLPVVVLQFPHALLLLGSVTARNINVFDHTSPQHLSAEYRKLFNDYQMQWLYA